MTIAFSVPVILVQAFILLALAGLVLLFVSLARDLWELADPDFDWKYPPTLADPPHEHEAWRDKYGMWPWEKQDD